MYRATNATKIVAAVPKRKPSQVFPGDSAGASLCRPISRPAKNAPMSPAHTANSTVNVASSPSLGISRRSSRWARHSPIQPAPSTVDAIATVADCRVVAIQCSRNASTIVLRNPAIVHWRPPRCAPTSDRRAPA